MSKASNKSERIDMKRKHETTLHPWQRKKDAMTIRKTKRAREYQVFDDEGILIGFIFRGK